MSNSLNHGVGLLPAPSDSPGTALGGVALFAGVFLLFMGFKEYSGSSTVDSGLRKIGLGIVAALVGVGIAATRQTSSLKRDEHARQVTRATHRCA
jgi:hypothetical protein